MYWHLQKIARSFKINWSLRIFDGKTLMCAETFMSVSVYAMPRAHTWVSSLVCCWHWHPDLFWRLFPKNPQGNLLLIIHNDDLLIFCSRLLALFRFQWTDHIYYNPVTCEWFFLPGSSFSVCYARLKADNEGQNDDRVFRSLEETDFISKIKVLFKFLICLPCSVLPCVTITIMSFVFAYNEFCIVDTTCCDLSFLSN